MVLLIQIAGKSVAGGVFWVCLVWFGLVFNLDNKGTSVIHAEMYVNLNARLHGIFYGVERIHLLHLF